METKKLKLEMKFSNLYTKTNYLSPIDSVVNSIVEYDMKSAGLSVIKTHELLTPAKIAKLESMQKGERNRAIGIMEIEDKDLVKAKKRGITSARKDFISSNGFTDEEILSIKNDAIFIVGRKARHLTFGKFIEFTPKNTYSSYHRINKLELYHNKREKRIDIKGLSEYSEDHERGILQFFRTVFTYVEYDRRDELKRYLIDFSVSYKKKELPVEYYKEFNHEDCYRFKGEIQGFSFTLNSIDESYLEDLNIIYNYNAYILPVLQRYLF